MKFYESVTCMNQLKRIATALERHAEVMLEHSKLLQESIAVNREHLALHTESIAVGKAGVKASEALTTCRITEESVIAEVNRLLREREL